MKFRKLLSFTIALSSLSLSAQAIAQDNTIRIIVPFSAGSGSDESTRFYADQMSKLLNKTVMVENKPGASGLIAVQTVLAEPADGNTILLASNSIIAVNPVVNKKLPYDSFKDLEPLHGLGISSPTLIVSPKSPYNSIEDIVKSYKNNKKPFFVGTYSDGYKLVVDWIGQTIDVEISHIPYKGGSQMVTDLIGGRLDFALNDQSGVLTLLASGDVKALAITADQRDPKMPDIPTMKELGYKDFESYVWSSLSVKAGTPKEVKEQLAEVITKIQNSEAGKAYHAKRAGTALSLSLDKLGEFQQKEYQRFKKIADSIEK